MKDKTIFNVNHLNCDPFAQSLGLAVTPRVRFVEKSNKQKALNQNKKIDNHLDTRSDPKEGDTSFNASNSDQSDEDLFSVKKVWRFDLDEDIDAKKPEPINKKETKVLTKAAVAKKMLKKHFKPNSRVVFNEDGTVAEDFPTRQTSEKVKFIGIDVMSLSSEPLRFSFTEYFSQLSLLIKFFCLVQYLQSGQNIGKVMVKLQDHTSCKTEEYSLSSHNQQLYKT